MTLQKLKPGQKLEAIVRIETAELIGKLVIDWARLEGTLERLIWHLLKLDREDGKTVTATLDVRTKLRMLRRLIPRHVKPKSTKETAMALLEVVETLSDERNTIVHGIWSSIMPDNIPVATSMRTQTDPFHVVSTAFPDEVMKKIISMTRDVSNSLFDLPDVLTASQKKYSEQLAELKRTRQQVPEDQNLAEPSSRPQS